MSSNNRHFNTDEIFEVLSNQRRRRLIYLLYDTSEPMHLGDLARQIATAEEGAPVNEEQYKRLYISLYQTHIPKLEEYGIVEYDPESKQVRLTDRVDELFSVFHQPSNTTQWWKYYVFIAVVSALIIGGYWALFTVNRTIAATVSLIPVLLVTILALYHYWSCHRRDTSPLEQMIS